MKKYFPSNPLLVAITVLVIATLLLLVKTAMNRDGSASNSNRVKTTNSVVCATDTKICTDGSSVSRISPTCEFAQCPLDANSNVAHNANDNASPSSSPSVRVVFYDGQSGNSIVQTKVELYADNGTRCVTTPCETNGRVWTATTDNDGAVIVDPSAVDESMTFTLVGYQAKELHAGGTYQAGGYWRLPLVKQ